MQFSNKASKPIMEEYVADTNKELAKKFTHRHGTEQHDKSDMAWETTKEGQLKNAQGPRTHATKVGGIEP
jgi:hypothetical protein